MILAAGKRAYKDINLEEYEKNQFNGGFLVTLSNTLSDHPYHCLAHWSYQAKTT